MQTLIHSDRSKWNSGPWDKESFDEAVWVDTKTGLSCLMRRNSFGAWCGYVAINPDHPLFKIKNSFEAMREIDVHGSITYADYMVVDVRRTPAPQQRSLLETEDDPQWVVGFDTVHNWDQAPDPRVGLSGNYKDFSYVKEECTKLAAQIAKMK